MLAGTRPAQQLSRRLDPRCLAALQHRAALTRRVASGASPTAGRLHRNPSVRSVRACRVSDGVYEASAVVAEELRVRAVAFEARARYRGLACHRPGDRLRARPGRRKAGFASERRPNGRRTGTTVPVLPS